LRSAYLSAAALAGLSASGALIALAWFLCIFDGWWPEMLGDPGTRLVLQALILAPVTVIAAAVALLDFPVHQPRAILLSLFVLATSIAISGAVIAFCISMRGRLWDAGMGVSYSWRPSVFLLHLFMTRWGGYAFAAVSLFTVIAAAVRAFIRLARPEGGGLTVAGSDLGPQLW
jgi:hypothetical protein